MEDIFTSLSTYGYLVLFAYSFGGGFIALLAAGVLAGLGELNLIICLFTAFIANFIGDNFLFYMARTNKAQVKQYFKKHRRNLALSHVLMKKHGSKVIFLQKYIYGIKTLIPLAIGLTSYNYTKFTIYNFIATIPWTLLFGLGGYYSGDAVVEYYKMSDNKFLPFIVFGTILLLIWFYFNKYTKKKPR